MFPFPFPWKLIGIALAAIAFIWLIHHSIVSYGDGRYEEGVSETRAEWSATTIKEVEAAHAETKAAQEEAKRQNEVAEAERERAAEQERNRQRTEEDRRASLIHDLESRYHKSLVEDASCAAWSRTVVACPFR